MPVPVFINITRRYRDYEYAERDNTLSNDYP